MGTTNASSFFEWKPLNEDRVSEEGIVRGIRCSVKLAAEFGRDENLPVFPEFRQLSLLMEKLRPGPFPRKLPVRVFLRNLFFLAVPNVALSLTLSMNRSSAIFNDRSFPGYLCSGGYGMAEGYPTSRGCRNASIDGD
jgi:hypothetical protein